MDTDTGETSIHHAEQETKSAKRRNSGSTLTLNRFVRLPKPRKCRSWGRQLLRRWSSASFINFFSSPSSCTKESSNSGNDSPPLADAVDVFGSSDYVNFGPITPPPKPPRVGAQSGLSSLSTGADRCSATDCEGSLTSVQSSALQVEEEERDASRLFFLRFQLMSSSLPSIELSPCSLDGVDEGQDVICSGESSGAVTAATSNAARDEQFHRRGAESLPTSEDETHSSGADDDEDDVIIDDDVENEARDGGITHKSLSAKLLRMRPLWPVALPLHDQLEGNDDFRLEDARLLWLQWRLVIPSVRQTKPVISERERGLLQRANSLNIHVSQLQRQQRILSSENEQLKRQMEMERERPAGQLQRERERQQELQLLRKKNAELAIQTKKLEEKVRSLEKKSKELPSVNGGTQQVVLSRERSIDNKLHHQQVQQQQQHSKQTAPTKWREKEMAMQTLQNRLTEREKEIGRLKEKLRDLTKKLQQEQHYNSKESLQQQQNGVEWTILSQGSRELEGLLKLVSKERLQLERNFVLATQGLQRSAELDVNRYSALEATNVQLRRQVEQLELLCKEQAEAAQQLSKRQQDREVLAERLKAKSEYSQDLENQLSKVIDKNAELTIENCDLKKQVQELHQFEAECVTLRSSLSTVESQCQAAQSEVAQLKEKMAGLDHVLRQMREAAEKKKELEKQHGESVNELRTAQAQLGLLASNKNTEVERAQHSQNIESLQSRIRELERKMELQNVRHDELLLELAALRRNQHHHHASNSSGSSHHGSSQSLGAAFDLDSRGSSPDSLRYLANGAGSVTRTTPLGQSASNLDALLEMDLAVSNYNLGKSMSQPVVSASSLSKLTGNGGAGVSNNSSHHHMIHGSAGGSDIERIMAKIEQDNRVLAELDKSRATISSGFSNHNGATSGSVPTSQSISPMYGSTSSAAMGSGLTSTTLTNTSSVFFPGGVATSTSSAAADLAHTLSLGQQQNAGLHHQHRTSTLTAPVSMMHPPLSPLSLPALPLDAHSGSLVHTVPLHSFRHPEPESSADMLEIPGKGRCYVYLAKYTYDPFTQSPNDNPEAEVSLAAGDYVLVWGNMDEDGFYEGELLDGRKGLVPSNFIQRLQGEDLVEFHRAAVLGLQICGDDSSTTSLPRDLLGVSPNNHPSSHLAGSNRPGHQAPIHQLAAHHQQQQQQGLPHQQPIRTNEPIDQDDAARQALDWGLMELQEFLEDEELALGVKGEGPVPPPRQLTLERQLNKSILIGWNHPEGAPPESGQIASYHVYVDGILRTTIRAADRCRALIEGVDSSKPHRISVRSVTLRRRASLDAACTMVIGKEVPSAPTCVRVSHVTATSALISWLPANSNYQHVVCVNHVEVRTVKPGIFRHTISGLSPNTIYRVTVKAKNIRSPHFNTMDETTAKYAEKYCTHVEFRTLPKGVPDPPVDVQVELGPQDGTLLVTWLPVTINSQSGKSNGVPVTGYAVYADGRKVTEVDSPTGDHALLDISSFMGLQAKHVTVRTKARESQSGDSVPTPVPIDLIKNRGGGNRNGNVDVFEDEVQSESAPVVASEEDIVGLWNLSLLASIKDTLESDERPSELSDIAEEPEEYEDCSSEGEMMNETSRSNNGGRRNFMEQANNGRSGGGMIQRNQYLNPSLPGPIPSIEITKDTASERSGDSYRGRDGTGMNPYDRNKSLPANRNPQMVGGRNAQGQARDNYYAPPGRNQQQNDGYYDQTANRRPVARGGRQPQMQQQQQTRIFVALFDYDPPSMSPNPDACDEELPFREGQLIKVRGDKDADGFYWGEVAGRSGYVPCNMVSEVQVDDERVAQELLKESGADGPSHSRTRRNLRAQGQPGHGRDRWGDIYANMPVKRMIALYDYDPQELSPNVDAEVELSFQTGDIIYVYGDMDDDGFYLGELRGQRGLVPSNFLTEAPPDYDPSQPRHKRQQQSGNIIDKSGGGGGQAMQDRGRDSSYYGNRSRERMDHDRMDPRDRGMSGAEGPPPPPRTTNHRPSDNSRDRRSDVYSPDRHEARSMAAVARDGSIQANNQRFYTDDSFSDVDDRFKGRPDGMDYAYNNGMPEQSPQISAGQQPTFNGGTGPVRNLPVNKITRGLPTVLPDPAVMQQQPGHNNTMMNADPNNPYNNHPNNAATQPPVTAPTSASLSSHFSFFGMGGNNQQQQQQQQPTGPSLIQKMMGGGGGGTTAPPAATNSTENPVEGLLSKGKDLIFKKFGL